MYLDINNYNHTKRNHNAFLFIFAYDNINL